MSDSLLLKLYTCQLQMRSHAFQGPRQMGVGLGDVDSNFNFHETTAKNLEHWYFQLIQISCFNKRSNLHRISGHLKQIESDFSPKRTRLWHPRTPPPPLWQCLVNSLRFSPPIGPRISRPMISIFACASQTRAAFCTVIYMQSLN